MWNISTILSFSFSLQQQLYHKCSLIFFSCSRYWKCIYILRIQHIVWIWYFLCKGIPGLHCTGVTEKAFPGFTNCEWRSQTPHKASVEVNLESQGLTKWPIKNLITEITTSYIIFHILTLIYSLTYYIIWNILLSFLFTTINIIWCLIHLWLYLKFFGMQLWNLYD